MLINSKRKVGLQSFLSFSRGNTNPSFQEGEITIQPHNSLWSQHQKSREKLLFSITAEKHQCCPEQFVELSLLQTQTLNSSSVQWRILAAVVDHLLNKHLQQNSTDLTQNLRLFIFSPCFDALNHIFYSSGLNGMKQLIFCSLFKYICCSTWRQAKFICCYVDNDAEKRLS